MATLENLRTHEQIVLQVLHTFGRQSDTCITCLNDNSISRMHATIIWDGENWLLKDTSSNGTYCNGLRQKNGQSVRLKMDDEIQFGSSHFDTWKVISLDPPECLLQPITAGGPTLTLNELAVLPSEDNPEVTLYCNAEGQWLCESQIGTVPLRSGDIVGTHNQTWRFIDGKPSAKTVANEPPTTLKNIQYVFDVSQNEEHVFINLITGEEVIELGERSHHYLLLVLARQRLKDKADGITEKEQGWLDKSLLAKMLGQEENHINVQIYRFRKQVVGAHPSAKILPNAIERRLGELRFASCSVEIRGGVEQVEKPQKEFS